MPVPVLSLHSATFFVCMIRHKAAGANSSWQRGDYGLLRSLCILQLPAKCCRVQRTYLSVHRADASCWNALICIDTGTITVYESISGGGRGKQLYTKQIPLTPGPLVVVLKVASDQNPVRNENSRANPSQHNRTSLILKDGPNLPLTDSLHNDRQDDPSKYWPPTEPDQVETIAARCE